MQRKLFLFITGLVIALAALACVTSPVGQGVTATLAATQPPATSPVGDPPTSTPAPTLPPPAATATLTLEPTAVISNPTPVPTETPATPDPNRNLGDDLYNDSFDGTSGWFWTFADEIAAFGAVDGELKVETKQGNNSWRYVIRDDVTAGDQQLRVVARTTTCPGNDEYGILYRANYTPDQKLQTYIYKLNCAGQARVEILTDTTVTVLKDWEAFPAIKPDAPAENGLLIWMAKDQFHFYVNDQYLFSLTNSTLAEGFYGFYVLSHSNGGGVLGFDDFTVKEVTAP